MNSKWHIPPVILVIYVHSHPKWRLTNIIIWCNQLYPACYKEEFSTMSFLAMAVVLGRTATLNYKTKVVYTWAEKPLNGGDGLFGDCDAIYCFKSVASWNLLQNQKLENPPLYVFHYFVISTFKSQVTNINIGIQQDTFSLPRRCRQSLWSSSNISSAYKRINVFLFLHISNHTSEIG